MALQHRSKRRRRMAEINIVPYIDVMLVLLIIFMVTAPMLNLGADIQLPQSAAKALQDEKQPVLVTVDQQGNVFLTLGKSPREQVDDDTLVKDVSAFVKQDPKVSVMLGGDKRVDYGRVNQVLGLLQQAGVADSPQRGRGHELTRADAAGEGRVGGQRVVGGQVGRQVVLVGEAHPHRHEVVGLQRGAGRELGGRRPHGGGVVGGTDDPDAEQHRAGDDHDADPQAGVAPAGSTAAGRGGWGQWSGCALDGPEIDGHGAILPRRPPSLTCSSTAPSCRHPSARRDVPP